MKPAPFAYVAAQTVEHALELKSRHGSEARFLAGGQSLIPAMNFRLAQPSVLIDIKRLTALDGVQLAADGTLRIGALTRHRTTERDGTIAVQQPLLHEAAPHVAHAQIRNRGTLGGNLAQADPASEFPAVVVALDARLRVQSRRGQRWIPARNFFVGVYATALEADEMLTDIELPPLPPRTGSCFTEAARRQGDYAMMGAAAVLTLDESGRCVRAALVFCSAGDTPVYAAAASAALAGQRLDDEALRAASRDASAALDPPANIHATSAYRRHLAGVLACRALRQALQRAGGAGAAGSALPPQEPGA